MRECISMLEKCIGAKMKESVIVRIYIHIACMVERLLFKGSQLTAGVDTAKYIKENERLWASVKESLSGIEEVFSIAIPDDEVYFIVELLKDEGILNSIGTNA